MAHRVLIPTPLRPYTSQLDTVDAEGGTVGEVLSSLTTTYSDLKRHLYADDGKLRHFVNVYVNDDDIRYLERDATKLKPGDVISIVPSVAGGAPGPAAPAVDRSTDLSNAEIQRYSRHLILPEVGMEGQKRIKGGSVLCVGAGGLGSPAALYLAAAGIGTLGIIDFDNVDESNLQRQILHGTPDVGRSKLQSARDRLEAINPEVRVETYETRLTSSNALELFKDYDVIIDGTDNFATRYLVNDACVLLKKPNVYGSIFRFEGQASDFATVGGPCYRCLYPEPPPPGLVPSCAEGGVLGVLPGVIGTHSGDRGAEADSRRRLDPRRPAAAVRRVEHEVPRAQAAPRPELPDLRRPSVDQGPHRLRGVLRRQSRGDQGGRGRAFLRRQSKSSRPASMRRSRSSCSTCVSRTNTRSAASPVRR